MEEQQEDTHEARPRTRRRSSQPDVKLSIPQAALLLQVSPIELTALLDAETLPSKWMGRHRRVSFQALLDYKNRGVSA